MNSRPCFFPLNALALHPQGEQSFCLTSTVRADLSSLETLQQQARQVDQSLREGLWPEACRSCRLKEQKGLQSRRQKVEASKIRIYGVEKYREIIENQADLSLRHLELSFSNACNLNCAMCSSEFSSSWIREDRKALEEGLEFRSFTSSYQTVQKVSKTYLEKVLSRAQEVDLMIIKGGEPTRDMLCLEFLQEFSRRRRGTPAPSIFIQTNGTRDPAEWLPFLGDLPVEIGFSFDGKGAVYEWIRGTSFERVLQNFKELQRDARVSRLSVDFTLSVFNCLHLPEFLAWMNELRNELPKLETCPFFQWAQEPYARADVLPILRRREIADQVAPLLKAAPDFFVNGAAIDAVLRQDRRRDEDGVVVRRWIDFVSRMRKQSLYDIQPELRELL